MLKITHNNNLLRVLNWQKSDVHDNCSKGRDHDRSVIIHFPIEVYEEGIWTKRFGESFQAHFPPEIRSRGTAVPYRTTIQSSERTRLRIRGPLRSTTGDFIRGRLLHKQGSPIPEERPEFDKGRRH